MPDVVWFVLSFLGGVLVGAVVAYIATSRLYIRLTRPVPTAATSPAGTPV